MKYKTLVKYIGFISFAFFGYFLYTKQLGAIPLLILSLMFFYLGFRMIKYSNKE
ncbi:hypothetical protein ACQKCU_08000 [Heyndrickxia sporothermodurans]